MNYFSVASSGQGFAPAPLGMNKRIGTRVRPVKTERYRRCTCGAQLSQMKIGHWGNLGRLREERWRRTPEHISQKTYREYMAFPPRLWAGGFFCGRKTAVAIRMIATAVFAFELEDRPGAVGLLAGQKSDLSNLQLNSQR